MGNELTKPESLNLTATQDIYHVLLLKQYNKVFNERYPVHIDGNEKVLSGPHGSFQSESNLALIKFITVTFRFVTSYVS